jgi:hypothetical protein
MTGFCCANKTATQKTALNAAGRTTNLVIDINEPFAIWLEHAKGKQLGRVLYRKPQAVSVIFEHWFSAETGSVPIQSSGESPERGRTFVCELSEASPKNSWRT